VQKTDMFMQTLFKKMDGDILDSTDIQNCNDKKCSGSGSGSGSIQGFGSEFDRDPDPCLRFSA